MMRRLLLDILIRLLDREVGTPQGSLTKEQEDAMLAGLWDNQAFRKRIADREKRLIYAMAGGEGMEPEPRDKYALHSGQRVELLLMARDAKAAWERCKKRRELASGSQAV